MAKKKGKAKKDKLTRKDIINIVIQAIIAIAAIITAIITAMKS